MVRVESLPDAVQNAMEATVLSPKAYVVSGNHAIRRGAAFTTLHVFACRGCLQCNRPLEVLHSWERRARDW